MIGELENQFSLTRAKAKTPLPYLRERATADNDRELTGALVAKRAVTTSELCEGDS